MTGNLWGLNRPECFWQCDDCLSDDLWNEAFGRALPTLELKQSTAGMDTVLGLTLGEQQFAPDHWTLGPTKHIYYFLKPLLPRALTRFLRRQLSPQRSGAFALGWPIEGRYARFQFNLIRNVLELSDRSSLRFRSLWPGAQRYAFVLTHDIESDEGQRFVGRIADMEEELGLRSSFNFVPEGYRIDRVLVDELRRRGFEIGLHGLKHDGRLFNSRTDFERSAVKINRYSRQLGTAGFRSPLTHRNPDWMQALEIEYDSSFFDTDPFEPIPGGTMSIWPFFLGRFVELPYTLVQDHTLVFILQESSPRLWLEKVDFIEDYHGMALLNSHPDYLKERRCGQVYERFLRCMKERTGFWHALPRDVARWWKARASADAGTRMIAGEMSKVALGGDRGEIVISAA